MLGNPDGIRVLNAQFFFSTETVKNNFQHLKQTRTKSLAKDCSFTTKRTNKTILKFHFRFIELFDEVKVNK